MIARDRISRFRRSVTGQGEDRPAKDPFIASAQKLKPLQAGASKPSPKAANN
jgi:hypothetical protein